MTTTNNTTEESTKESIMNKEILEKIHKLYFIDKITDTKKIAEEVKLKPAYIRRKIRSFKKAMLTVTPIPAGTTTTLELEIKANNKKGLLLYVKTCKSYEDYLAKKKDLKESHNLWDQGTTGSFYHLSLINNYLDDVNKPVIHLGQINFAILRIKGISGGLTFRINSLMTEPQIREALIKLKEVFTKFYAEKILRQKVNIKLEVLEEK